MRSHVSTTRALTLALAAVVIAGTATGCSWFHKKGPKGDYALSPEMRPLEVPPDLTQPDTAGAMQVPTLASQSRGQQAATAQSNGFAMAGGKDEVFDKVGTALEAVDGVAIDSRAKLLGAYDVSFAGEKFLIRVAAGDAGSVVSAVDVRGVAATGPAPKRLIAELKARLAAN